MVIFHSYVTSSLPEGNTHHFMGYTGDVCVHVYIYSMCIYLYMYIQYVYIYTIYGMQRDIMEKHVQKQLQHPWSCTMLLSPPHAASPQVRSPPWPNAAKAPAVPVIWRTWQSCGCRRLLSPPYCGWPQDTCANWEFCGLENIGKLRFLAEKWWLFGKKGFRMVKIGYEGEKNWI